MAEGKVRVDGADRRRKTVSRVRAVDREGPSWELGPNRGRSGRSGAELLMIVD